METFYVLVEGQDDIRLLESFLNNGHNNEFHYQLWEYANKPKKKIVQFLRVLRKMNSHYIFLHDLDETPRITTRRASLCEAFPDLDYNRTVIVLREIEAWYWAGLDQVCCEQLRFAHLTTTEHVTKELFNANIRRSGSRVDFLVEITKLFSPEAARYGNHSFDYFLKKAEW